MSYLTCGIQERLQQAFARHSMCLDVKSDYVIVENSSKCTEEKVKEIVVGAGFCPFVAPYRMEGKVVFTISPYQVPGGFTQIAPMIQVPLEEKAPYFGVDELSNVLRSRLFVDSEKNPCAEDKWDRVNWNRQFVSSALEEALSEIIAPRMKEGHPAVEIGSGIGYSLPKTVSSQTIRIQPSLPECQLLRKAISDPIYQMNIEDLYALLLGSGKKIPLIFALNVFDTMSSDERSANLERLSRLQNLGDRILIMLDNNPLLSKALKVLKELRPGFVAYPYIPLTRDVCTPLSVILVPESHCPTDLTLYDFDPKNGSSPSVNCC